MIQLHNAFTLFLSLLVEAMPFLLFGVLLSSLMLLLIDEKQLITKIPRNPFLGVLIGSLAGFLFPVCECGNIPVARRLILQGIPTSVAIGFLLAAPTINPIVIWSTWIAFRDQPEIVWLRVLFSLTIALTIATIFTVQKNPKPILQPLLAKRLSFCYVSNKSEKPSILQSGTFWLEQPGKITTIEQISPSLVKTKPSLSRQLERFIDNVSQEMRELGGMLIIGSAIAATIQVFVPREIILSLGQDTVTSILAMMILAGVVSICSTVDAFFALSFASTFTSSSLLAFLIFGPIIDIKSIGLMLSIFRPRIIFYFFILAAQLTFILALAYAYF